MLKKPVILLLLAAILLAFILIGINSHKLYFTKKKSNFALKKSQTITRLVIRSARNSLTIEQEGNNWIIDSALAANTQMIAASLAVLEKLQMEFPVSKKQKQAIADSIKQNGTTVSLFNGDHCIYTIQFIDMQRISYALNRHDIPFAVSVAGYEKLCLGDVLTTDKFKWLKNLLIDLNDYDIKEIRLIYPKDKTKSFGIKNEPSQIRLTESDAKTIYNSDEENLSDYLHFFKGITFEQNSREIKFLMSSEIDFILEIDTKEGKQIVLEAHPLMQNNQAGKDINIFAGIVNKSDTIALKYNTFDPILVDKSYFLKK